MSKKQRLQFTSKIWLYPGETAQWHFVTLPKDLAQVLKRQYSKNTKGFGSLPVRVTLGKTVWDTSIFPDKYSGSYLLPLKAAVRRAEDVHVDEEIKLCLQVR